MSENGCQKEFIEYLSQTFGNDFCTKIRVPINACFGERVIYILQDDLVGRRILTSAKTFEALESFASEMAGKTVQISPPVESGRYEPRLVDLPGWEICYDLPLKRFLDNSSPIPEVGSEIMWLLGTFFGSSNK